MLKAKREKTMQNPQNKTATTIYLDQDLFDALRAESENTGAAVAEICRRACRVYLELDGAVQYATLLRMSRSKEKAETLSERMNATYNEARARETGEAKPGRPTTDPRLGL
jgi:hypothetical protein